jgi:hypothetical protein
MQIKRNGSQGASKGPEQYFTGAVRIEPLFQSPGPAQFRYQVPGIRCHKRHQVRAFEKSLNLMPAGSSI